MKEFTTTQKKRLTELNASDDILAMQFEQTEERDKEYKNLENSYRKQNLDSLKNLLEQKHKPLTLSIEEALTEWLTRDEHFTKVTTPVMITADMLERMTITKDHHLSEQVFWVDKKKCLRPMLAPNLYTVMHDLHKITGEPVRIFEIGSCFRKESQGAEHMNEFTMLNLVELGTVKDGEQPERLKELARSAMKAVGIEDYSLESEDSQVYKKTVDIVAGDLELASGAYGPHPLDNNWDIFDTWVGLGIGIERLAMTKGEYKTIKRGGKTLAYLDGVPLKL